MFDHADIQFVPAQSWVNQVEIFLEDAQASAASQEAVQKT